VVVEVATMEEVVVELEVLENLKLQPFQVVGQQVL
tara:strand:+ start:56 stop:160 length:105 start_codon:yes stop_codon:yes gene_type:complete